MTTIAPNTNVRLRRYRLTPVSDRLSRVVDPEGRVVGHVARIGDDLATRYRARRFRPAAGGFVELGDFWRMEDAVAVLHDSR